MRARERQQLCAPCGPVVSADEPPGGCPVCQGAMLVEKTVSRPAVTLAHGAFTVRETTFVCAARCRRPDGTLVTVRAAALAACLPPKCSVGYDVLVAVGRARFVEHRQREEIREQLRAQGVLASTGEITVLGQRFLGYLEALHEARADELGALLAQDGGWPLHVDASCEDGRGTLVVAYAGWRRWVLGAWKVPTERADVVLPRLRKVVARFGPPCAVMRDLGRAMTEACDDLVATLDTPVPVLACHLHFLSDVGGDLLGEAHDHLRGLFRRFKTKPALRALARDLGRALGPDIAEGRQGLLDWQTAGDERHLLPEGRAGLATVRAMAQWVLDYRADGSDQGFPFDLPYLDLHARCRTACRAADAFLRHPPATAKVRRALGRLHRAVQPADSEVPFVKVAQTLRGRLELFTELRNVLRLRPVAAARRVPRPTVLSADQAADELRDIEADVARFKTSLVQRRPARGPAQDQRSAIDVVLTHLDRHGEYLFGHAIPLPAATGGGVRLVDRTNNCLEHLWDEMKHGERRRSGRKILTQDFEQLPPAAALAMNLRAPDYVAVLCGSLDNLPHAFAQLDAADRRRSCLVARAAARVADASDCDVVSASLPTADRRLIRTPQMTERIQAAARSRAPRR